MNCSLFNTEQKRNWSVSERNKSEEHGVPLRFWNTKSVQLVKGTVPLTDRNKLEEHSVPLRRKNGPLT